jgi:Protein of unknown function (DUF2800)
MTRVVHSFLSASAAERWMSCPGSAAATRGIDSGDTAYSREGTAAHAVHEQCLRRRVGPHTFVGQLIEGMRVTADMADAIAISVAHCRRLMDTAGMHWIEQSVSLAPFTPPTDMFGTLDFACYFADRQELHIVDLKFGAGVYVRAKGNPQLRYYALAAAATFELPVSTIVTTVVQPRFGCNADPIRSAIVHADEMAEFAIELIKCAETAMRHDAPFVAGSWCKFCAAKNTCATFQGFQRTELYREFDLTPS